ncbi:hypothetical protein CS8_025710 [Cupriavidus sp. 8B]
MHATERAADLTSSLRRAVAIELLHDKFLLDAIDFSPKVGRRLSLGSYETYRTWLMIEANPAIETFTERPARVGGTRSAVIDFWV